MTQGAPKVWAGTTLDARRDARRRALLDVGLELLGGAGQGSAVTVRSVCRHAKLTDRYFYESFADRDELLVAVYDQVAERVRDVLNEAVAGVVAARPSDQPAAIARAAVEAFLGELTADPRKGRVLLLAPMTDAVLSARAAELMPMFAELIRVQLAAGVGSVVAGRQTGRPPHAGFAGDASVERRTGRSPHAGFAGGAPAERMTATALIGALSQLFIRWLDGTLEVTERELTDYSVRLLLHSVPLARPANGPRG